MRSSSPVLVLASAAAIFVLLLSAPTTGATRVKTTSAAAAAVEAKRDRAQRHATASVHRKRDTLETALEEVLATLTHHDHGRGTPLEKSELKKVRGRAADLERKLQDKPYLLPNADMEAIRRRARGASAKAFAASQPAGHYEKLLTKAHADIVSHEKGRKKLSPAELGRLHEKKKGYEFKLRQIHGHGDKEIHELHRRGNRKSAADYKEL
eukprot:CAMPEP_0197721422 /NCGR_PEP_ID=MMETSP1434-20131217/4476_1 /TAXON_ID=265543 /ORGANISM="Minutocellus polymorphus, Strain CCMP3303" /LENGTH=209 /DNA_ID=CAMNT_0043306427 /DNA_START=59 /DNA_END=688 /DNA_ORIENTATION=-